MPKTTTQRIIFTLMMVFVMVYIMTVYTVSLGQGGLSYGILAGALREMWTEYIIVFCLIYFVITRAAMKIASRILDPASSPRGLVMLSIQCCTVLCIVPVITLIATFLHHGATSQWFVQWITTLVQCFPMAFFTQLFFAGPLVRFLFRKICRPEQAVRTGRASALHPE